MTIGSVVVWLLAPMEHGVGTIVAVNAIGWLEVDWTDGEVGCHPAQHLELADVWEAAQAQALDPGMFTGA